LPGCQACPALGQADSLLFLHLLGMEFDLHQKYVPKKQKFVKLLGGIVEFYVYLQKLR
jgi:hypothetical protein